jgi:hypothetical protein
MPSATADKDATLDARRPRLNSGCDIGEDEMKHAMAAMALVAANLAPAAQAQTVTPRMFGVKMAVRDFQKTTQFYSLLGMQAGAHHNEWEWELKWDSPERGSSIIMVREDQGARFHVTRGASTVIISTPDVHAALARLRGAGFAVPGDPRVMGSSAIIMIQDPDGDWIELAGPAPAAKAP